MEIRSVSPAARLWNGNAWRVKLALSACCSSAVLLICFSFLPSSFLPPSVNKIPDASWICERCRWGAGGESCCLCPVRDGAMKRTTDFQWAHLVCAQWIPEVFFRLPEGREPIDVLMTPARRHAQTCVYCQQACGVCVECSDATCHKYFHITCGQRNGIFLEYSQKQNSADVIVSYCREHSKRWSKKRGGKSRG